MTRSLSTNKTLLIAGLSVVFFCVTFSIAAAQSFTDITAVDDPVSGRYCASTNGDATQVDALANDINAAVSATTTGPGKATSIRTRGNYAFVGGYQFRVYDISDPQRPTEVASLRYSSGSLDEQQIRDIHINGDYAYLPDSTAPNGTVDGKVDGSSVYVIDISNPANPSVADSISYENGYYQGIWGSESVDMRGDDLFVVDPNPSDLYAIDASNPRSLQKATTTALSEVPVGHSCRLKGNRCDDAGFGREGVFKAKEVRISGNYAYTVHRANQNEVRIFDITDLNDVNQVGSFGVMDQPETLEIASSTLYVTGDNDIFQAYDVSSPTNPTKLGEVDAFPNGDSDVTAVHHHGDVLYATHRPEGKQAEDSPLEGGVGGVVAIDVSSPTNPEKLWAKELVGAPEGITWHEGNIFVASSGESDNVDESLVQVLDPDNGYLEINDHTQPKNGTVTIDDQGTSDPTDDEFSYYPSATGTDSFTYNVSGDPTQEASVSATATVAFDVGEDQCDVADISVSADPQDTTLHKGSSTISWSFDDVHDCETQNGTSQWRNIDPMSNADCPEGVQDGSCSGSDTAEITDLDSDTTFTLACDTANDGDQMTDVYQSADVTVTDLTACPFVEGDGGDEYDHVIDFGGESIYGAIECGYSCLGQNVSEEDAKTDRKNLNLDPGSYQVGVFMFDDSRSIDADRSEQTQQYEQGFAHFQNSDGSYVATSAPTDDLADDTQIATSSEITTVTFEDPINSAQIRHHAYFNMDEEVYPNSLEARCIAIKEDTANDPSTNLSASTTSIPYNGSTTLDWTYQTVSSGTTTSDTGNSQWANTDVFPDTQTCQQVGDGLCSGSHSTTITNLTQDTTFNITFDGTYGGTASDSVSVAVADKPVQLAVSLDAIQLGDDAQLTWNDTNMDSCAASSNPTNSQWASSTNPDPSGGTTTVTDLATSTKFTLTCTKDDTTLSDSVNVEVIGFDTALSADNIWGVPYADSLTTQSRIDFATTDSFGDTIQLSASVISSPDYAVDLQFLDSDGSGLGETPVIDQTTYEEGVWLQAQVGPGVEAGRQQIQITADAVNGTSSASHIIDMFIRGIGEI